MTKTPKLPTALSPSSIDLYHQCPRRYEEEKIKGFYSPPGIEAVLGTFVHLILEKLMLQGPEDRTLDIAKDCAREAWEEMQNVSDLTRLKLSEDALRAFRWAAWQSVENYFVMEPPHEVDVIATEQKVNAVIDGVPFRGIIDRLDRIDDKVVVSDYKNGKVPAEKYRGPKKEQLNLYGAMVRADSDILPERARLIFTAHSEFIEVTLTEATVAKIIKKAKKIWEEIHENFEATDYANGAPSIFKPKTGPLCAWCPFVEKCPEGMAQLAFMNQRGWLKEASPGYKVYHSKPKPQKVKMPRRRS